jgi:hypothetical protein
MRYGAAQAEFALTAAKSAAAPSVESNEYFTCMAAISLAEVSFSIGVIMTLPTYDGN